MAKRLKVIDLFCGAGGFSEGFAQMGFDVVYVLDNWGPACVTHKHNHPKAEVVQGDILEIDPSELPKADVLIGGPPCTEFSFAKKGGKGDISLGMKLVTRFLKYVVDIKPKYWIMENVPRLLNSLPSKVRLKDLGSNKKGDLRIPHRKILNSANYGAPQIRQRLFSGVYPVPFPTHSEIPTQRLGLPPTRPWVTLRQLLDGLPNPLKRPKKVSKVVDPNYPHVEIDPAQLTDHFYDSTMSPEEARDNKKAKTDHSWYGKMAFPDRLDRPSRTIMATQLRGSRETIAIEAKKGKKKVFRQPTIRECACLQCYPITYQFLGDSFGTRYRLVGNSVPVLLSRAIALAILEKEGIKPPKRPKIRLDTPLAPSLGKKFKIPKRGKRRLPSKRKFRDHIPDSKGRGYRVDIDNEGGRPHDHPLGGKHEVEWVTRLYIGSGKEFFVYIPDEEQLGKLIDRAKKEQGMSERIEKMIKATYDTFPKKLPDATTMQAIWAEWTMVKGWNIHKVLERVSRAVRRQIPEDLGNIRIFAGDVFKETKERGIPIDTLMMLVISHKVCEMMNDGEVWIRKNPDLVFRFEDISE